MEFLAVYPEEAGVAAPQKMGTRLSVLATLIIFVEMKLHMDRVQDRKSLHEPGINDDKVEKLALSYGCKDVCVRKIGNDNVCTLLLHQWSAFDKDLYECLLEALLHFERQSRFATPVDAKIARKEQLNDEILDTVMHTATQ